ncbi:hypothetical protein F4778DRAFT_748064 [Xylariomycetidae sp. FL2044]|nr:hypothetical protein F4778DRAFT_767367 [Xylariomycetidae sp. FL2044]KAH9894718.1 hypothetical protein F4778DRAFT_748064 [Xylariomycetidae sp. FL2044]
MLRLFRSRPNLSALGARVNRTAASQPQTVHIQNVKLRRRWFRPMHFLIAAGVYYACYQVYSVSVFGTLNRALNEQVAQMSEKERKEFDEEELDPMFIPLPGTTRMVEPKPYRASDPEWLAFVKLNKDRQKMYAIQKGLADLACRVVESHSIIQQRFGKEMKVLKWWLDVEYPTKPPPTFVRKGISIDDDSIAIAEEPVDSFVVFRLRRILLPSALTLSLWSFSGALLHQNLMNAAKYLGYETKDDPTVTVQQTLERIQQQLKKPPSPSGSQAPSSLPSSKPEPAYGASSGTTTSTSVDKRAAEPPPAPETPSGSAAGDGNPVPTLPKAESGKPKSAKDMYMIRMTSEHTSGPWEALKRKYSQTWRPLYDYPPRGSVRVTGLVEINTPRAIITVDVSAWYDPKTKQYDNRSMIMRLRTIRVKQQRPLRP